MNLPNPICALLFPLLLGAAPPVARASHRLAMPAAFEKETGVETAFTWRAGGNEVRFANEGTIAFSVVGQGRFYLVFEGSDPRVRPIGEEKVSGEYSFYHGVDSSLWRLHTTRYRQIRYPGLYPGIDVVFRIIPEGLEYDLELAPHASPDRIRMRFASVAIEAGDGELKAGQGVIFRRPRTYQVMRGNQVEILSSYAVSSNGVIGFQLGDYDPNTALVVDPAVNFSASLGSDGFDAGYAACVDAAGNMYIAGESDSTAWGMSGRRNTRDAFVAKLSAAGNVVYVVYFGGNGNDSAQGIAVDTTGRVYVTGTTGSTNFPATSGVLSTGNSGQTDAFVLKLDVSGSLVYSTYLGSGGEDRGYGIALDSSGNAYVAGVTSSVNFPGTSGRFDSTYNGGSADCFVAKLDSTGHSLLYATYLGGSGLDLCRGVAVDSAGNAYVTGTTYSSNFPTLGAYQSTMGGGGDAFVAKINPTASALVYSTFIGGLGLDEGNAIAAGSAGNAYVAGYTGSSNFPVTAGAFQTALKGPYNAFVVKLSTAGTGVSYSTLLGGSGVDSANALAVDSTGQAAVGGFTSSFDLPTFNALQPASKGVFDGFAAVLGANGNSLLYGSYLGGAGDDRVYGIAVGAGNVLYLTGMTSSNDFPGASTSSPNNYNAFVHQVSYASAVVTPPNGGLVFIPVTPCRLVDTRGYGGFYGTPSLQPGAPRTFPVPATNCGIPASAQAFSLNVTVVPMGPLSSLTVWPTGQAQPAVPTVVSLNGRLVASAALIAAGTNGAVSAAASGNTELIIDINGYFDQPGSQGGLAFYSRTPCRLLDTRGYTVGALSPAFIPAAVTRNVLLATAAGCQISPLAQSYSLNFTAIPRKSVLQFLSVWPSNKDYPNVSTLNAPDGQVTANAAIMPVGPSGGVTMYVSEDADILADINGIFAPPGSPGALYFHPLPACLVADTRGNGMTGALGPPSMSGGTTRTFPVTQSACGVPATAVAFALNVTVFPPGPLAWLTLWPTGQDQPYTSTLNAFSGAVVANSAIVPSGGGSVNVYVNNRTDVVIATLGYFAP